VLRGNVPRTSSTGVSVTVGITGVGEFVMKGVKEGVLGIVVKTGVNVPVGKSIIVDVAKGKIEECPNPLHTPKK